MTENYLIYLRKSRQDDPNESVEEVLSKHENILQEYSLKHFGYLIPENNIYREIVSGETIQDRPKIQEILKLMESGVITGVLVVDVARLSRGELLDAGTIVQAFKYTDTLVVTPNKTYNLDDKYDKNFFEMELTRGNYYLEYTKEILHRGRIESVKAGNYIGESAPYGYKKIKIDKCCTLAPDDYEAPYVKEVFRLYGEENLGCQAIANKLNELGAKTRRGGLFTENTVKQMITNETYLGKVRYGYKATKKVLEDGKIIKKRNRDYSRSYLIADGKHEALISQELWDKVQNRIGKNPKYKQSTELVNPLAGLLKCNKCKGAMFYQPHKNAKRSPRFTCRNHFNCDNVSCNADVVIDGLIEHLKVYLSDFEVKIENSKQTIDNTDLIHSLESQLSDIKKRQDDICDYLEKGVYTVDMFLDRKEKLSKEYDRLSIALDKAKEYKPTVETYKEKIVTLHQAIDMMRNPDISAKDKNNFLKTFIKVIWYEKTGNAKSDSTVKLDVILF